MTDELDGHEKMLLTAGWFVGSDDAQERAMRKLINKGLATGWGEPPTERGRIVRQALLSKQEPSNG